MDGIYKNNKEQISELLKKVKHVPNQIGCIFLKNDKVLGMELFASNSFFKKYIKKILSGYLLDQLASNKDTRNLTKRYAQKNEELMNLLVRYKRHAEDVNEFCLSNLNIDRISNQNEFEYVKKQLEENDLFLRKIRARNSQYLYILKKSWKK